MSNKITDEILKSIEIMVNSVVKKLDFDRTYEGIISAVNDNGYTVKYNGTEINIKTTDTNMYKKNDIVQFCIPCGCKRRAHIITSSESLTDKIYPVGSIYMSVNDTSPTTLFGGTWEQIKDRFLLSAGDKYSSGSTGGESTHKLTIDEMPSHRHQLMCDSTTTSANTNITYALTDHKVEKTSTGASYRDLNPIAYTGGSQEHNNMPPYLTVYVWKRTA